MTAEAPPGSRQPTPPRPRSRVLVVDDETALRELILSTIRFAGFDVISAGDVGSALEVVEDDVAVAVLDVMLPDGSGFDLAQLLRSKFPHIGVLFLTARDGLEDRLTGFAFGADDYLTKPFSVAELIARVTALHRRVSNVAVASRECERSTTLVVADLTLDDASCTVTRAESLIDLSPTEFKLLRYLMHNAGVVVSKDQIVSEVWNYAHVGDVGVVEKFISQLRRKLGGEGDSVISTVRGFGYTIRTARPRG